MDGSLIDLCGAVLMWRTSEGMKEIPVRITTIPIHPFHFKTFFFLIVAIFSQTEEMIDTMRHHLNATRPQCPVGLTTLVFPTSSHQVFLLYNINIIGDDDSYGEESLQKNPEFLCS